MVSDPREPSARIVIFARISIPGSKFAFRFRISIDAFVAGPHTDDTVILEQQLGAGKSGKDIDAALFHLLAEPARKFVQRNDVVAVVLKGSGNDRQAEFAALGQEENMIFLDRLLDRRAAFLPVRHQLVDAARIHDGAGNDVGADLLAFLENGDGEIFIQFSKLISGGKTGRPTAHDQNIDFQNSRWAIY